jgi:hypothetical protein
MWPKRSVRVISRSPPLPQSASHFPQDLSTQLGEPDDERGIYSEMTIRIDGWKFDHVGNTDQ